jgi:ribosomal protein S6
MIMKEGPLADGFFYLNGVKQLAYQLVKFEGAYYYINDFHKYAVNKTIYLTASALEGTDFKPGYYEFGADGKMILKHGADADGYFYINGMKQSAYQLIKHDDGNFYFIGDYNKYVVNKTMYMSAERLAGTGLKAGNYKFGADGKMIIA